MRRNAAVAGLALALASCGSDPAGAEPDFRQLGGIDNYTMVIPGGMDADSVRMAAKEHCGEAGICSVYGWTSANDAAGGMPMTDAEVASMAFSYTVNRTTGFERSLWDCRRFLKANADECMAVPE